MAKILSDDELLALPPIALNDDQKRRRQAIKRNRRIAAKKAAQPEAEGQQDRTTKPKRHARSKAKAASPAPRKPRRPRRTGKVPIHRPGEDAIYTDGELLDLPDALLSEDQVRRKRALKRRSDQNKRRRANRKTREPGTDMKLVGAGRNPKAGKVHCIEIKANGDQCGGWQSYGTEHCRWHMTKDELRHAGLEPAANGGYTPLLGVKTTLTPTQQYRRVLEKAFAVMINKKLNVFGLKLVGFDPHGEPILEEYEGGGAKIYGESKDGDIVMTMFDDLGTMNKVFEEMMDRSFGKARQALQIEGGVKPVEIKPVRTGERAREVAGLLDSYGIIPRGAGPGAPAHTGRQRRRPATPSEDMAKDEQ